jgi:hypothetical protein
MHNDAAMLYVVVANPCPERQYTCEVLHKSTFENTFSI